MEGVWRHAQNTRRMDRSASICRRFINGSCRFGPRCNYRHEWPVLQSSQICRYFQKGGCWYGDRCRYLHVLQPEVAAGRRGSVPTVASSRVVYALPDRRGSEPAFLQAQVTSTQECSRSQLADNIANPQHNIGRLATDIAEEQSQDMNTHRTASWESVQSSEVAQACARDGRNEQEISSSQTTEDGASAAASSTQGNIEEIEAFLQSKNVTCGICMDKVYEKTDPRNHIFGILPNCNHAFCLQCIMTWRKTKDLGPDVVKSCPQCRVRSAFYVPNRHWVEGQAKESLIAAFKEKFRNVVWTSQTFLRSAVEMGLAVRDFNTCGTFHTFYPDSKRRCSYYTRYRCCPFKTECLYRHDKHARRRSFPYDTEDEDYDGVDLLNLFIAMTLIGDDDDDDDDFGFPFYLSEEYGF